MSYQFTDSCPDKAIVLRAGPSYDYSSHKTLDAALNAYASRWGYPNSGFSFKSAYAEAKEWMFEYTKAEVMKAAIEGEEWPLHLHFVETIN